MISIFIKKLSKLHLLLNKLLVKIFHEITTWIFFLFSYFPGYTGIILRRALLKGRISSIGKGINFGIGIEVFGGRNMSIGDNVSIMKFTSLYAQDDAILKLGNNISINANVCISADQGKIIIGNNVLIAPNVVIRASNHRFNDVSLPIIEQGHISGKIIIEDDCWIGSNAVITSNVTIGRGSVIGAGSVVTKNVNPFSVVAGVPAKLIKSR